MFEYLFGVRSLNDATIDEFMMGFGTTGAGGFFVWITAWDGIGCTDIPCGMMTWMCMTIVYVISESVGKGALHIFIHGYARARRQIAAEVHPLTKLYGYQPPSIPQKAQEILIRISIGSTQIHHPQSTT